MKFTEKELIFIENMCQIRLAKQNYNGVDNYNDVLKSIIDKIQSSNKEGENNGV